MPGGRPRKHARPEEAAQAHAQREQARRAGRIALERRAVEALMEAVEEAAARGETLAQVVKSGTPESLLRNLAHWFRTRSGALE
jgi:hypothetical protein